MENAHSELVFGNDNSANMRMAISRCKNILVCGVVGVGKIRHTVEALKDNPQVYYTGNPVDYEGKLRPGSYEKYLTYIHSLKHDIRIIEHVEGILTLDKPVVLIIDEIFDRPIEEREAVDKILDMPNVQVIQIVGCLKYMGKLIEKFDLIVELHHDTAFSIDRDLARAICSILGKKDEKLF